VLVLACVLLALSADAQGTLLADLQVARATYPTPMAPTQLAALLNEVAWAHRAEGWGLLRKTGGNRCPRRDGVEVSCDFLVYQPTAQGWDVLIASDTDAIPSWQGPYPIAIADFVAPIDPGLPPEPEPIPVIDFTPVLSALEMARVSTATAIAESEQRIRADLADLRAHLNTFWTQALPIVAAVLGALGIAIK
jgi:hypothetical protein